MSDPSARVAEVIFRAEIAAGLQRYADERIAEGATRDEVEAELSEFCSDLVEELRSAPPIEGLNPHG